MYVKMKIEDLEKEALSRGLEYINNGGDHIKLGDIKCYMEDSDDPSTVNLRKRDLNFIFGEYPVISHIPNAKSIQERFKNYDFENATGNSIISDINLLKSLCDEKEFVKCLITRLLDSVYDARNGTDQVNSVLNKILSTGGKLGEIINELSGELTDELLGN